MARRTNLREESRPHYLPYVREDSRALRVISGGLDDGYRSDPSRDWPEPEPRDRYPEPRDRYPEHRDRYPEPRGWDDEPPRHRPRRRSAASRVALKVLVVLAVFLLGMSTYLLARDRGLMETLGFDQPQPEAPAPIAQQEAPPPASLPQPASDAAARPPVPDLPALAILVRNAIVALDQANVSGNYSVLREIAAPAFQVANSPSRLSEAFAELRATDLDLGAVAVVDPKLYQPPAVDDDGMLTLAGFFEAGETTADFDLVFQWTDAGWRLFGIGLQPTNKAEAVAKQDARVESGSPQVPDDATMVALIRGIVIALNQANATGNYSVLREIASPNFQQANSFARLSEIFADLRGRQLDLSPIAVIDPRLFRPATIDERGMLRLTGFFPSNPEQVNFDLAFQKVDGDWRLFGIGLNTSRTEPQAADAAPAPPTAPPQATESAPTTVSAVAEAPAPAANSGPVMPPQPRLRPAPRPSG